MINHVSFQGRFTKDLELGSTPNNVKFVNFTLAWSEKYGDQKEINCFLNCAAYRGNAEFICKYFSKGDMVVVEGKLITRSYQDQQGIKKSITDLVVDRAHFCGSKKKQLFHLLPKMIYHFN